jgi:hypothetical protein
MLLTHSPTHACCSYQKGKWVKARNLPKCKALSEFGEHWTAMHFNITSHHKVTLIILMMFGKDTSMGLSKPRIAFCRI